MPEADDVFLEKAASALLGAESELAASRYDNVANRCYYACFQAAVAALEAAGIRPAGGRTGQWSHSALQAQFSGKLINRRKRYPSSLRNVLSDLFILRQLADYSRESVSEAVARQALRRSREFVAIVRGN